MNDGKPAGPATDYELRAMATQGHLSPSSPIFRDTDTDWRDLAAFEQQLGLTRNAWGGYSIPLVTQRAPRPAGTLVGMADPGERIWAFVIDSVVHTVLNVAAMFLVLPLALRGAAQTTVLLVLYFMSALTYFGYEVLLTAVRGQTVGKSKMNIEVVRKADGSLPSLGESSIRALVKAFTVNGCTWPLVLLVWLVTPNRFTLHDAAAETAVQRAF
ncbi:MAG: RDD family protein [Acidimicrobiales bacterium]